MKLSANWSNLVKAHARLGEVLFVEAKNSNDNVESLAESIRRFCRSIELCDHFLRGYYGLKIVSLNSYIICIFFVNNFCHSRLTGYFPFWSELRVQWYLDTTTFPR